MTMQTLRHETTLGKCQELAALVARHTERKGNGIHSTAIAPLEFIQESEAYNPIQSVCEPILALVVQGSKQVMVGEETYRYGVAQYLVRAC